VSCSFLVLSQSTERWWSRVATIIRENSQCLQLDAYKSEIPRPISVKNFQAAWRPLAVRLVDASSASRIAVSTIGLVGRVESVQKAVDLFQTPVVWHLPADSLAACTSSSGFGELG